MTKNDIVDADDANDDDGDGDDKENDADGVIVDDGATCRMKDSNTKGIGSV